MVSQLIFDILNRQLQEDSINNTHTRQPGVCWPSDSSVHTDTEIKGKCLRRLYYEYTETSVTNEISPRIALIAAEGKALENEVAEAFRKDAKLISHNQSFKFQPNNFTFIISGETDLIVDLGGETVGIEVKSGGGYGFIKDVVRGNSRSNIEPSPRDSHLFQTAVYLDKFRNYDKADISKWFILYLERGEVKDITDYTVELDDDGNIF